MARGFFLTVEGIEGCGKTTQLQKLALHLRGAGRHCVTTREPGGTPLADRIRAILLDPQEDGMDPVAELFLYAASRRQHVVEVVKPALEAGAIVLSDRFTDATLAYQGFGRLLNLDRLRQVNDIATDGLRPDLTLLFDLPEAAGLQRARSRNAASDLEKESRLEGEDLRFHRRVREGYLSLAESEPDRFVVIDSADGIEGVFEKTLAAFHTHYPG
ncbi:MAG TPA: dTMP kinase [Thermoanaerobaculia bacterium]|nr:dTMP kinase [Thermoanaerobaculia bacterium]